MEDLIKRITGATTLTEYEAVHKSCVEYLATASDEERREIKEVIRQKANSVISESIETRKKALEYIDKIKMKILP